MSTNSLVYNFGEVISVSKASFTSFMIQQKLLNVKFYFQHFRCFIFLTPLKHNSFEVPSAQTFFSGSVLHERLVAKFQSQEQQVTVELTKHLTLLDSRRFCVGVFKDLQGTLR